MLWKFKVIWTLFGEVRVKKYQKAPVSGSFFSKWSFSLLGTLKNYRAIGIIPHTCLGHWLGNFCVRSHRFTFLIFLKLLLKWLIAKSLKKHGFCGISRLQKTLNNLHFLKSFKIHYHAVVVKAFRYLILFWWSCWGKKYQNSTKKSTNFYKSNLCRKFTFLKIFEWKLFFVMLLDFWFGTFIPGIITILSCFYKLWGKMLYNSWVIRVTKMSLMDGLVSEWVSEWVSGLVNERLSGWVCECVNVCSSSFTYKNFLGQCSHTNN